MQENLQVICKACHAVKTARESSGLFTRSGSDRFARGLQRAAWVVQGGEG